MPRRPALALLITLSMAEACAGPAAAATSGVVLYSDREWGRLYVHDGERVRAVPAEGLASLPAPRRRIEIDGATVRDLGPAEPPAATPLRTPPGAASAGSPWRRQCARCAATGAPRPARARARGPPRRRAREGGRRGSAAGALTRLARAIAWRSRGGNGRVGATSPVGRPPRGRRRDRPRPLVGDCPPRQRRRGPRSRARRSPGRDPRHRPPDRAALGGVVRAGRRDRLDQRRARPSRPRPRGRAHRGPRLSGPAPQRAPARRRPLARERAIGVRRVAARAGPRASSRARRRCGPSRETRRSAATPCASRASRPTCRAPSARSSCRTRPAGSTCDGARRPRGEGRRSRPRRGLDRPGRARAPRPRSGRAAARRRVRCPAALAPHAGAARRPGTRTAASSRRRASSAG